MNKYLAPFFFTSLLAASNSVAAQDMGKLVEAVDQDKAKESVDAEQMKEAVSSDEVDYKKAYDSVDKQKAAEAAMPGIGLFHSLLSYWHSIISILLTSFVRNSRQPGWPSSWP